MALPLRKRWGQRGETLPPDHPAWHWRRTTWLWDCEFLCVVSPQGIIMGGGLMRNAIFPLIRAEVRQSSTTISILRRYSKQRAYIVPRIRPSLRRVGCDCVGPQLEPQ